MYWRGGGGVRVSVIFGNCHTLELQFQQIIHKNPIIVRHTNLENF